MGAEETRAYVAAMITEQLGLPGFELLPEQVGGGDGSPGIYAGPPIAAAQPHPPTPAAAGACTGAWL